MKSNNGHYRFRAGAIALITALTLAVSACSPASENGGSAEGPEEVVDLVRIDLPSAVSSLDPIAGSILSSNRVVAMTSASLFSFKRGSGTQTEPQLAESVTAAEDGLTHTVVLRPDLKFSDGSDLTSEDVVASLTRLRDTPGANARFVSTFVDITADDDTTVTITTSTPSADLAQILALPATGIVTADAVGVEEYFAGEPVYSGPFVPEGDFLSNTFAVVKNENYGGPTPLVERVEINIVPDASTSATRLQAGDVDLAPIPVESASLLSGDTAAVDLFRTASLYVIPNNRDGKTFSDVRLRQAIASAIDREALAKAAYGETAQAQHGPYLPFAEYPEPIEVFPEPDLDAARALLAGTECEDGCSITLTHNASESLTSGRAALVLQQQLAEIGMEIQVEPVESAVYIENALSGNFEMNMGESGSWSVQETFLNAFTTCVYSGCDSSEFVPVAQAMVSATDEAEQTELSREVLEMFTEWTPIVPVAGIMSVRGYRTAVMDVVEERPNATFWFATAE